MFTQDLSRVSHIILSKRLSKEVERLRGWLQGTWREGLALGERIRRAKPMRQLEFISAQRNVCLLANTDVYTLYGVLLNFSRKCNLSAES